MGQGGGGLLLVTDHYPTGVAARSLAERFGVKFSGGWTDDPANRWPLPGYGPIFGHLVFSLENGLLPDHPITRGSDEWEKIEGVSDDHRRIDAGAAREARHCCS